jgi:hypothetical protein
MKGRARSVAVGRFSRPTRTGRCPPEGLVTPRRPRARRCGAPAAFPAIALLPLIEPSRSGGAFLLCKMLSASRVLRGVLLRHPILLRREPGNGIPQFITEIDGLGVRRRTPTIRRGDYAIAGDSVCENCVSRLCIVMRLAILIINNSVSYVGPCRAPLHPPAQRLAVASPVRTFAPRHPRPTVRRLDAANDIAVGSRPGRLPLSLGPHRTGRSFRGSPCTPTQQKGSFR